MSLLIGVFLKVGGTALRWSKCIGLLIEAWSIQTGLIYRSVQLTWLLSSNSVQVRYVDMYTSFIWWFPWILYFLVCLELQYHPQGLKLKGSTIVGWISVWCESVVDFMIGNNVLWD